MNLHQVAANRVGTEEKETRGFFAVLHQDLVNNTTNLQGFPPTPTLPGRGTLGDKTYQAIRNKSCAWCL